MTTLVVTFSQFGAALLMLGLPLFLMARRKGCTSTERRFLLAAVGTALLCAMAAVGSEMLVSRCESADHSACDDVGGSGLQILAVVTYTVAAWVVALQLRDCDSVNRHRSWRTWMAVGLSVVFLSTLAVLLSGDEEPQATSGDSLVASTTTESGEGGVTATSTVPPVVIPSLIEVDCKSGSRAHTVVCYDAYLPESRRMSTDGFVVIHVAVVQGDAGAPSDPVVLLHGG
ncbi:MAG: hypothetical protein GY939_28705, partial [Actinomycetia bacterium]|nr:hypothetical protein [Actinomycetes bacterium]